MEMLQRLKNTMSSAIPGNPITRDYDMGKLHALAGPGLLWKVYEAVKRSTKQESSVWILEKRQLEKFHKNDRDELLEIFKKGISNLTRLRHPHILQVHQAMEESRDSIAFASEPVFACLMNIYSDYRECSSDESVALPHLRDYQLFDTEKKYGFLQLSEALAFLHNDCHQVHGNVCPSSVILAKNGSWKLAGFDFTSSGGSTLEGSGNAAIWQSKLTRPSWQSTFSPVGQPVLDYLAPEKVLDSTHGPASDMFSLGQLLYAVYNNGRPLIESKNDLTSYKRNVTELSRLRLTSLQCLPENVREYVKLMLNADFSLRPDANQFSKIPFFDDPGVLALLNMDNVYQLDNLAKSQFYKALPKTVINMPKRINIHRIYPQLSEEFVNVNMVPFVLPSVLHIVDMVTEKEFCDCILPKLLPVFKIVEPIQVTLICLQNLTILMSKLPANDFKNHLLPMINRAIETDNGQVQELCLRILPSVSHLIDYNTLKNAVVPRLKKLLLSPGVVSMKIKSLQCIAQLMENMDKWFVLDEILPTVSQIQSREPGILMGILGIYRVAFTHAKLGITKDHLASRVLPYLLPLCIESNLNLDQFDQFMGLIREMIHKLENEHRHKLEHLHTLEQEQRALNLGDSHPTNDVKPSITQTNVLDSLMSSSVIPPYDPNANRELNKETKQPVQNLTLEEKQRLAQQKEQMERMKQSTSGTALRSGGVLEPTRSNFQSKVPPPKDLTSSLLEHNLMGLMLSNNAPPAPSQPQLTTTTNHFSTAPGMGSISWNPTNAGGRPPPMPAWGVAAPMMMPGTVASPPMMTMMPMGRGMGNPGPMLLTSSNSTMLKPSNSVTNKLSSTDIDDLLG